MAGKASGKGGKMKLSTFIFLLLLILLPGLILAQLEEQILMPADAHPNHGFGTSVTLDSDRAVVGAAYENVVAGHSGSAYVFKKEGANWVEEQKLLPSDGEFGGQFGWSVAVQGNDILVGEDEDSERGIDAGAVYYYHYNPDSAQWYEKKKITSSDEVLGDYFGSSISISGEYAIIGARGVDGATGNDGAAYIFHRNDTSWSEVAKITPQGIMGEAYFGTSVCMEGDFAIIGSYGDDELGKDAGAAYIFKRNGNDWEQQAKLSGSDTDKGDQFGLSVTIYGQYAAVGATGVFGTGGVVYIYKYDSGQESWNQCDRLTDTTATSSIAFGFSVSIYGDYLAVGVRHDNQLGNNSGSVCFYTRQGDNWNFICKILASDGESSDQFSYSTFLNGNYLIAGAPQRVFGDTLSYGGAYIYTGFTALTNINDKIFSLSPVEYALDQNYPNPFNNMTMINYQLPSASEVELSVYNLLGQKIVTLVSGEQQAGLHHVVFNGTDLSSGIYIYSIKAGRFNQVKKMLLLR
jgi:hypothetical protein